MMYHDDLVNDEKRVNAFKKAILEKTKGIVYDLGTGSGILAKFASKNAGKIYALEINPFTYKNIKKQLKNYNINLILTDAITYEYPEKPDTIICEMLDTALIDEEQVQVINNSLKYKKESTIYIPKSVRSKIELINANLDNICYYENNKPIYVPLTNALTYDVVEFNKFIEPKFTKLIKFKINNAGLINAIKITTYTFLTDEIICGPTPMLNPPLLLPTDNINVKENDILLLKLSYKRGGGLDTIHTDLRKIK